MRLPSTLGYFGDVYVLCLTTGTVLIMNNASFHKGSETSLALIRVIARPSLLFLPPYS